MSKEKEKLYKSEDLEFVVAREANEKKGAKLTLSPSALNDAMEKAGVSDYCTVAKQLSEAQRDVFEQLNKAGLNYLKDNKTAQSVSIVAGRGPGSLEADIVGKYSFRNPTTGEQDTKYGRCTNKLSCPAPRLTDEIIKLQEDLEKVLKSK